MNKQQHMIALDLDGTFLTDDKDISQRNRAAAQQAIDAGHIVVIATGRPHRASIQYYDMLRLDTPMVNFNGALIHHPLDSKWDVLHNPLPVRTAREVTEAAYAFNVNNIVAEVQDHVYLDKDDHEVMNLFKQTRQDSPFTIGSLLNNLNSDPTSLLIHPREDHITRLRNHLDDYHAEVIEHRNWGAPWNMVEVVKKGINKAVGLHKLAYYFGVPTERIIAFGDEDNDLEMIDYAGVGVAMGNAIEELKSVANHITASNEEDGVGLFLEDYLNLNIQTT